MSLDTTIPGDPASIHELADWLGNMHSAVEDADAQMNWVAMCLADYWRGSAGYAFHEAVQALRKSQFPVSCYLHDAAEVFHAYANRLSRGRDYFDDVLRSAQDIGLTVQGNLIQAPTTWLTYCPNPNLPSTPPPGPGLTNVTPINGYKSDRSASPEVNEYNSYRYRLVAYKDACAKVGTWEGELDQWLADHMAPLVARVDEMSEVAVILVALRDGSELIVDGGLEAAKARFVVQMSDWRTTQDELSDLAMEAKRLARSGNPARRAAYEAFDFSGNATRIGDLEVEIGRVAKYSKIIPIAGTVYEISVAGYAMANGASESSVLAGMGGGVAGGAGGAAIAGAFGIPVVGEVALVVGAGYAVGEGSVWLWEAEVDLDVRESIDYWLEENVFWDSTSGTLKTG